LPGLTYPVAKHRHARAAPGLPSIILEVRPPGCPVVVIIVVVLVVEVHEIIVEVIVEIIILIIEIIILIIVVVIIIVFVVQDVQIVVIVILIVIEIVVQIVLVLRIGIGGTLWGQSHRIRYTSGGPASSQDRGHLGGRSNACTIRHAWGHASGHASGHACGHAYSIPRCRIRGTHATRPWRARRRRGEQVRHSRALRYRNEW